MDVIAVVVTYNRKELLKNCIDALRHQTKRLKKIIIVDNASTDGTELFLSNYLNKNEIYHRLPRNMGASEGFCEGAKTAAKDVCDWVWMMDDDSIPQEDALEKLASAAVQYSGIYPVSFLCSKVIWKDGKTHRVNIPKINRYNSVHRLSYFDLSPYIIVNQCSFVSVLINVRSIRKYGYPIKDFFIWQDDIEYTRRITSGGELGLLVPGSIVTHATYDNYIPDPMLMRQNELWKFKYECRNKVFVQKEFESFPKVVFFIMKYLIYDTLHLLLRRKGQRCKFAAANLIWTVKGIFFHPAIEKYKSLGEKEHV